MNATLELSSHIALTGWLAYPAEELHDAALELFGDVFG